MSPRRIKPLPFSIFAALVAGCIVIGIALMPPGLDQRVGAMIVSGKTSPDADSSANKGLSTQARSATPFTPKLADYSHDEEIDLSPWTRSNLRGTVHRSEALPDGGWLVSGMLIPESAGEFVIQKQGNEWQGLVQWKFERKAIMLHGASQSAPMVKTLPLADVLCEAMPLPEGMRTVRTTAAAPDPIPALDSVPGATAVLYLDLDGEVVSDPHWNGGRTFTEPHPNFTDSEVRILWGIVAEDFAPFNVSVTTKLSRYNAAPVGRRMRCIISPYNFYNDGNLGRGYVNSWSRAGKGFRSTIPCFVWAGGGVDLDVVANGISHEVGHTLGLSHDGSKAHGEYYRGHLANTDIRSGRPLYLWIPIMGSQGRTGITTLSQWSKGDYTGADNQENDLAIIASSTNGFGYVGDAVDPLPLAISGSVDVGGIIRSSSDVDGWTFSTPGGTATFNVLPTGSIPNLHSRVEIRDVFTGEAVASDDPIDQLNASVSASLPPGSYRVNVGAKGNGAAYSAYGSLGAYRVTGSYVPLGEDPPLIFQQPTPVLVKTGGKASMTVKAISLGTPTYQWQKDGEDIPGATNATYTLAVAKITDTGSYLCIATNDYGQTQSESVQLDVRDPPKISGHPLGLRGAYGSEAVFSVQVSGTPPFTYQWLKNRVVIPGQELSTLMLSNLQRPDAALYSVRVTNAVGTSTSKEARLSLLYAPSILIQPISQDVREWDGVILSVRASGSATLRYQWLKDGVDIPRATRSYLTLPLIQALQSGSYQVRVTNVVGTVLSEVATINVEPLRPASISHFYPTKGPVGSLVSITGDALHWTTAVYFYDTVKGKTLKASHRRLSPTELLATVPSGAKTSAFIVTTRAGVVVSPGAFEITSAHGNDAFALARLLPPEGGTVSGSNLGMTSEEYEPFHAMQVGDDPVVYAPAHSAWFRWTPLVSGDRMLYTTSSVFDARLAVYSGPDIASLAVLASNDNANARTKLSQVRFTAVAGETYYIAVDGFSYSEPTSGLRINRSGKYSLTLKSAPK